MARPAKDQPWYKVLISNSPDEAYLPEQDLRIDASDEQVNHPLLGVYFNQYDNGHYKNTDWKLN